MAWLRQLIVACAVPNTILVSGTITHPRYIDPAKKWVGPACFAGFGLTDVNYFCRLASITLAGLPL